MIDGRVGGNGTVTGTGGGFHVFAEWGGRVEKCPNCGGTGFKVTAREIRELHEGAALAAKRCADCWLKLAEGIMESVRHDG